MQFMVKWGLEKRAQFKIQQMAFMLVFVFIFFVLVGLFFLQLNLAGLRESAQQFEQEQVLSALVSWSQIPELSCSDNSVGCIDLDKVRIFKEDSNYNRLYFSFWPVASVRVYKVASNFSLGEIECPNLGCNYYSVFESGQQSSQRYSTYVSLCQINRKENSVFKECEMATLSIGGKVRESD